MILLTEQRFLEITEDWKGRGIAPISFFFSFPILDMLFNHRSFELFEIEWKGELYVLYHKKKKNEFRFLFREPTQELVDHLLQTTGTTYVAANVLPSEPTRHAVSNCSDELIVDIDRVVALETKKVRHDYRRAIAKHPELRVSPYSPEHQDAIKVFLAAWRETRTPEQNQFALTENDLRFLEIYGNSETTHGVTIWDGDRIVAYALFIPTDYDKTICISAFSKILRGYPDLGMFLAVEKYRAMQTRGFKRALLGSINNDFKKHFIPLGTLLSTYGAQLYAEPGMRFRVSAEGYLGALLV